MRGNGERRKTSQIPFLASGRAAFPESSRTPDNYRLLAETYNSKKCRERTVADSSFGRTVLIARRTANEDVNEAWKTQRPPQLLSPNETRAFTNVVGVASARAS